jgi:hypothetical protein
MTFLATSRDELHMLVSEGADVTIPLEAVGTGITLVAADVKDNTLDFRHQFVGRPFQVHACCAMLVGQAMTCTASYGVTGE